MRVLVQLSSEGVFIVCDEKSAGHVDSGDLYSLLVDVLRSLKLLVLSYKREIVRPCALFFNNIASVRNTDRALRKGISIEAFFLYICMPAWLTKQKSLKHYCSFHNGISAYVAEKRMLFKK